MFRYFSSTFNTWKGYKTVQNSIIEAHPNTDLQGLTDKHKVLLKVNYKYNI